VTRREAATGPVSPTRVAGASRDGGGGVGGPTFIAPALSVIGLVLVGLVTMGLFTGQLPIPGGSNNGGGIKGGPDPNATVAPSNVIIVPTPKPDATDAPQVLGSIIFAKQGNIWIEEGSKARQITNTGRDSMPSWSPDGQWIYFIESAEQRGLFPSQGSARYYTLTYPILTRIHPDGTGRAPLLSGLYKAGGGSYQWFYWLREPEMSPDGRTIALVSDGPDPTRSDVVMQFYDTKTGKLTRAPVGENPPLGHQDVVWRPDGKLLLYVKNARDGSRGAPAIWQYNPATHTTSALTGPGYTSPAFSPDGRWVAATRTTTFGTDVVILNAKTGAEVLRVTNGGQSWAPVWSPSGDSIAYLTITYQIVDLRLTPLKGRAPSWTLGDEIDLTQYSGLDGSSRPDWFIPADQLPAPSPAASASSTPASPSPSAPGPAASTRPPASPQPTATQ
jgi:dipeptidyl aminopeptidase/acylaminoacyl peptidase